MRESGKSVPIIAKLEKPQAIERLEEILEVANGVMIARGDLGVEMPPERVPIIQKLVIQRAGVWRRPVITATQMLESMTENPRPTRAEASDVANAIFDGTDVVMLSGETASGRYPRETVAMMVRIILEAGASIAQLPRCRAAVVRSIAIRLPKPSASPSHTPPKICPWARSPFSRKAATRRACFRNIVPRFASTPSVVSRKSAIA
jgi:pyruvate kinase